MSSPFSPPKPMVCTRTFASTRQLRGLLRRNRAGRVDAIGQQDHHPLPLVLALSRVQALDRQCDGIADRGLLSGQTDHAVVELLTHAVAIQSSRASRA